MVHNDSFFGGLSNLIFNFFLFKWMFGGSKSGNIAGMLFMGIMVLVILVVLGLMIYSFVSFNSNLSEEYMNFDKYDK